jgi:hypothetical protein
MSTFGQNLTQEEQTLHHYVAMLMKKLEEFRRTCKPSNKMTWTHEFKVLMVCRHLSNHYCESAKFILLEKIIELLWQCKS